MGWDDPVPDNICTLWKCGRSDLHLLQSKNIPRCYFDKKSEITSIELHGFSDASELAYAAVLYLIMTDSTGNIQVMLVTSKTKVAPIKQLVIPHSELCGSNILAQLLHHVWVVQEVPLSNTYTWIDSTIVLHWLDGNPRRFKTYVRIESPTLLISFPLRNGNM